MKMNMVEHHVHIPHHYRYGMTSVELINVLASSAYELAVKVVFILVKIQDDIRTYPIYDIEPPTTDQKLA